MAPSPKKIVAAGRHKCSFCSNYYGDVVEGRVVKLHRVPANKFLGQALERRLRLLRPDYRTLKQPRVCSEHFVGKQGSILGDDIPRSIKLMKYRKPTSTTTGSQISHHANAEQELSKEVSSSTNPALSHEEDHLTDPEFSMLHHDYALKVEQSKLIASPSLACQTDICTTNTSTQTNAIILNSKWFHFNCDSQQTQTDIQTESTPMHFEHVCNNDATVRLYTGLKDRATFQALFDKLATPDILSFDAGRKNILRPVDQFFMTLMRLRLGLVLGDLSFRFSISTPTCSRIINRWIDIMYEHLSFLIYWPTRNQINATMPEDFQELFPNTRAIISCTELLTETPLILTDQSLKFSQSKANMTWKGLIGITPNGVISFVSDLWPGPITDKQIVEQSGLLDLCEKGDIIIGDDTFLISDLTTPLGIQLITPPRKKPTKHMTNADILLNRHITQVHIHLEKHVERIKKFRILRNLVGTMKANVSKIWKICNYLTTLN
uniref:THAP-type domain-containing protein n=1 Tax=Biomphalaria glabrata TaxID=6526 RepID=A0A2C9JCP7_BIOGL